MRLLKLIALAVTVMFFAVACSGNKGRIVGTWSEIGGDEILQFHAGGSVSITARGMAFTGTYQFLDEGSLKMEMGGLASLGGPQIATVKFDGDRLTLTNPKGRATAYNRVKQ